MSHEPKWKRAKSQHVDYPYEWKTNMIPHDRLIAYLEAIPEIADSLGLELQERTGPGGPSGWKSHYRVAPKHKIIYKIKKVMKDD